MDITEPMCTLSTTATNCPIQQLMAFAFCSVLVIGAFSLIMAGIYMLIRDKKE